MAKKTVSQQPVVSCGVILFTVEKGERLYAIAQRRDTIEYVDFVRGHFPQKRLHQYVVLMTNEERRRLQRQSFDDLWNDLWVDKKHRVYKHGYNHAKKCFHRNIDKVKNIISFTQSKGSLPWVFPKGKREKGESDFECAMREFVEETKLSTENMKTISNKPVIETFNGSNNKKYRTKYFITYTPTLLYPKTYDSMTRCRRDSYIVSSEIYTMKWVTKMEATKYLCSRRVKLLESVEKIISETF